MRWQANARDNLEHTVQSINQMNAGHVVVNDDSRYVSYLEGTVLIGSIDETVSSFLTRFPQVLNQSHLLVLEPLKVIQDITRIGIRIK
jgi:hypothetical protein